MSCSPSPHVACHLQDLPERLEALRRQDETAYRSFGGANPLYGGDSSPTSSSSSSVLPDYPEWREKIAEWSYHVVDHFDLDREIVAVSISYLDRYVDVLVSQSRASALTKRSFQLVAVTCLYVACKLYGNSRKPLRLETLVELSRGYFTPAHVQAMERQLLEALGYRVHPPTAQAFIRHLSLLLPPQEVSPQTRYRIEELAQFVSELGVFEHSLSSVRKSSLGLAALLNVMAQEVSAQSHGSFLECVRRVAGLDPECDEVLACQYELAEIHRRSTEEEPEAPSQQQEEIRTASPVSVVAFGGAAAVAQQQHYATAGCYCPSAARY